jgi:electron transfer DM13
MAEMAPVATFFSGHPLRIGGAAVAVLLVAGLAWYLASPLFVRTYTNEALPAPATSIATAQPTAAATAASAPAGPRVLAMGELGYVDSIHNGTGPVRIVEVGGQRFVRFEDVAITNAPDVHVYLSRETGGKWADATSLYLGALKATNGSFNYELPAAADLSGYRSVVVWCRAFRVLITWADLT